MTWEYKPWKIIEMHKWKDGVYRAYKEQEFDTVRKPGESDTVDALRYTLMGMRMLKEDPNKRCVS